MQTPLQIINDTLLGPGDLALEQLESLVSEIMVGEIDFADLFFERAEAETFSLEDGEVKDASYHQDAGVGVRTCVGDRQGFAYSSEVSAARIREAANVAIAIQKGRKPCRAVNLDHVTAPKLYSSVNPIPECTSATKIAFLLGLDAKARSRDPRIIQVQATLSISYREILVAATDGTLAADIRPLVRLSVSVLAEKNGRRERGSAGLGGRYSLERLLIADHSEQLVRNAVDQALVNLDAKDCPAGEMPVVLASGWPGVLLHEAVGHGLEGDFNRKGSSFYAGKIGQRVASQGVTVVDDGTLADRRGSLNIDDEGRLSQRNVLIKDGILVGYMQDKLNARLMAVPPTGNGRRESYAHLPMPRMTNTFMEAGDATQEDMIKSVKKGIFAVNFGGGQVDITSGQFVFAASEAYLIENGKIVHPVKGATLIGHGPEVMSAISMIGDDLALDTGIGICGKNGQSVPVGVGQPSLKIDRLTVGGTA
ncbi:metalloprotease TldD [Litorivicinus sp.]|nr:metalloprotease TldD [Litorivicinus sp.]MDB9861866.1 metalloprotease TldD [Litorivicinus sp.]MDC1208077.1 metalloprotease TldD [Litorivicinus sp.]MDC1466705.1 metalloprotease TldD [Litorivicinus sp.]